MSLERNMMLAEAAAKYANDVLWGRASNRSEDIAHLHLQGLRERFAREDPDFVTDRVMEELRPGFLDNRMADLRLQFSGDVNTARQSRLAQGKTFHEAAILKDKLGKCGEHAVLAAAFLKRSQISCYMADTDDDTNHCFVVIDGPAGLDGATVAVTRSSPGGLATPMTVICDPWWHDWFSVADWPRKMWRIFEKTKMSPGALPETLSIKLTSDAHVVCVPR